MFALASNGHVKTNDQSKILGMFATGCTDPKLKTKSTGRARARGELHVGDAYVPIYPLGLEKSLETAEFTKTTLGPAPGASSSRRRQDREYPALQVASLR